MDTIIVIGAGPAGLTAAQELLRRKGDMPLRVIVAEASARVGGLSQTVEYKGNRIDIGGHRFFSKSERVKNRWAEMLPRQADGADPDAADDVMLRRSRLSRIYFLRKFFDYPISLRRQTFARLGLRRTFAAGFGYLAACVSKRPERSLEDFYINRFGRPLYSMFFEDYTRKVWGLHPSQLGADWGAQRVKGLSITAIVRDMLAKAVHRRPRTVETSLIEEFDYPKYGPGQMWQRVADEIAERGGEILFSARVSGIDLRDGSVSAVTVTMADGSRRRIEADAVFSSMPLNELVAAFDSEVVPQSVSAIARELPYRDFITVGLLVRGRCVLPDNWIYVQERDVRVGRLQVFNNWSPYMVASPADTTWLGLEYFCSEGDELWTMSDAAFKAMAVDELSRIGLLKPDEVIDAVRINMTKAYPAYHGAYYKLPELRRWLDSVPNLYCIGRNGQHRYNNMDHSMLTAMTAVDVYLGGESDRSAIWGVNTENEYHEGK